MASLPAKYLQTINDAAARLLARAENSRGLDVPQIEGRLAASVEKYLLRDDENAGHAEIIEFIDSLHAEDLCLIIACENGDENAWGDLVLNYDSAVKSAAYRFCKGREDAEDLAGSIWAELHGLRLDASGKKKGKLAYYSGKGSLGGWLRAVTNQLAIDEYRKMKRIVQIEEDREFENLAKDSSERTEYQTVVSLSENPEQLLSESEAQADIFEALQAAVADLEAENRLIMKMYYFDDLKLQEIADTFGFHEATASRKLVRIQTAIRKSVERRLSEKHGWGEEEVRKHLSESAERLGAGLEKLFAILIFAVCLQDAVCGAVLSVHI